MPILLLLGCAKTINSIVPSESVIEEFASDGSSVEVTAVIYTIGNEYTNKYTFFAETKCIQKDDIKINSPIGIKVIANKNTILSVGDKIKFSGSFYFLNNSKNPGTFDEKTYYNTRNIEYKMYPVDIKIIGKVTDLRILLSKLNSKIAYVYDNVLPYNEASLVKAMIVGDKTDLPFYMKNLFSKAGIYHIIAISGLHIHILAFIVLFFSEKFHKKYGKIFAAIFVVLYCIFTGANVAAIRAACMFLIYILGKFIYRESDTLNSLTISCFVILVFQPLYLFDVGFQYSFCAVLSIILFSKPITILLKKWINSYKAKFLSSAISVNFITKAVVWFNFYGFAVLDILANLIIIPFVGIVVFFGFIIGFLGLFSLKAATFFSGIIYLILKFYEFICEIIADIPFTYILVGKPHIFTLISYLVIIFVFAMFLYRKLLLKFAVIFSAFIIAANIVFDKFNRDLFKITMLDVGQGDSFVLNYDNKCIIIDGGGNYDRDFGSDTGTYVLFPYLKYMGINYVDGIFVTHMDVDHVKGIIEIIDCIDIGKIYISDDNTKNELYNILKEKAHKKNIPVSEISSKDSFNFGDIYVNCVYPFEEVENHGNTSSIVLKICFGNNSFLFTGDIDKECEKKIIDSGADIRADVLKLSHHGSKYSNSDEFIDSVNPKIAIVSAGNFKIYGHPDKSTIDKFNQRNINVLNTNEKGAVELFSDGNKVYFKTMK